MRSKAIVMHPWSLVPMLCTAVAALMSAASPAWAAKPIPGSTYRAGSAGDDTQVVVKVSASGRRLTPIGVVTFSSCTNGRDDWLAGYFGDLMPHPARLPIASSGTYAGTFEQYPPFLDVFVVSETYSLSGRFIRSGNAVKVAVRTVTVGEGGTVCDTSERNVVAKRMRRRTYQHAGPTARLAGTGDRPAVQNSELLSRSR